MRTARLTVAFFAMGAFGAVSAFDLVDSPHDLSTGSAAALHTDAADGTDQTCVFCHTPHDATTSTQGPLWNRAYTPAGFTEYDVTVSPTFDGGVITLGAQTYSCMSCHDGSLALDNLVNYPGAGTETWVAPGVYAFVDPLGRLDANNNLANGPAALSTDLTDDHPVGFAYATSQGADPEINPAPAWAVLFGGYVECATCHDVHDQDGGGPGFDAGYEMFLRQTTDQSAICTDCHNK